MFARVTTFSLTEDSFDTVMGIVESEIEPKIREIEGLLTAVTTYNRDTSQGHSMAIYRDAEAAEAARGTITEVWGTISKHLKQVPTAENCEVVLHVKAG